MYVIFIAIVINTKHLHVQRCVCVYVCDCVDDLKTKLNVNLHKLLLKMLSFGCNGIYQVPRDNLSDILSKKKYDYHKKAITKYN